MLDKEIEEQEDRFRALSRGKLGRASLLAGAPRTRGEAAGRGGMGGATTAGGFSGGGSGGVFGGGGSYGGLKNTRSSLIGLQRTVSSMGK